MSLPEEPEYQVFVYVCPDCGHEYREANSIQKHPDHQHHQDCPALLDKPFGLFYNMDKGIERGSYDKSNMQGMSS